MHPTIPLLLLLLPLLPLPLPLLQPLKNAPLV
jgi:hypothetical protein